METITASHFKNHFGEVLDRASKGAVRIHRRGRGATVLLSAEAYDSLQRQVALAMKEEEAAMGRLAVFALSGPRSTEALRQDYRGAAILEKHTQHWQT